MRESKPVCREIVVTAPAETAFDLFTAHLGAWWPLADKNVLGQALGVAFEDGRLVERSRSATSVWAEVVVWEPPTSVRLAFHPGAGAEDATDLLVTFTPVGAGTRVNLDHRGWERLAGDASDAAREEVRRGWVEVLDCYLGHVDRA